MPVKTQIIPLAKLENNNGQIEGVPKNPRFIKDYRYQKLKQSIIEDPEMLDLRELLVYPLKEKFIVIAGNQRLAVCRELNFKETLCKILPADTPVEKLKRYIIKDNIPFGEPDWDALANEWEQEELIDWGIELSFVMDEFTRPEFTDENPPNCEKDEKYFYIEYYNREDDYKKIKAALGENMETKQRLNADFFKKLILNEI